MAWAIQVIAQAWKVLYNCLFVVFRQFKVFDVIQDHDVVRHTCLLCNLRVVDYFSVVLARKQVDKLDFLIWSELIEAFRVLWVDVRILGASSQIPH